jgi:hypothetical protein
MDHAFKEVAHGGGNNQHQQEKESCHTPLLPSSSLQIASFKQVSFWDGGDWLKVTMFTSGCIGLINYTFGLAKDDNNDNGSSSVDDDCDIPSKDCGGSGRDGCGGGGSGKKEKTKAGGHGRGGKKKGGERKISLSGKHNNIKQEASMKLDPGACVGGFVSFVAREQLDS